jgi:hypothetical protein
MADPIVTVQIFALRSRSVRAEMALKRLAVSFLMLSRNLVSWVFLSVTGRKTNLSWYGSENGR